MRLENTTDQQKTNSVYFNYLLPWLDARYVVLVGNLGLVLVSVLFFHLQRSWSQIALTLMTAILFEGLFFSLTRKYTSQKFSARIPSALAEAGSCLLLCRSKVLWIHPMMVAIAVISKYLVRKNERDHIFNPANFAIIFTLCLVAPGYYEFRPDDFSVSIYALVHVIVLGLFVTWLADVWRVAAAYLATAWVSALFLFPGQSLVYSVGPELGTPSLVFAWLMMTDPRSAPRNRRAQVFFGASIALAHMLLRFNEVAYSRFIALFFVTAGFYFGGLLGPVSQSIRSWKLSRPLSEKVIS